MEAILIEGPLRRGSEPKIVIDALGDGAIFEAADIGPIAGDAGDQHLVLVADVSWSP